MSQIIFFLVDILTIAYFFIICVKKATFLKDRWKWDYIFQKASIMKIKSSEQKKNLLIQIQLFQSKAAFVLSASVKFE